MQELGCSSRCPLCRTARRSSSRPGRTRRCRRNRPYRHPRDIAPRTNIARRGETRGLVQLRHRRPQYRQLSHNKPHRTRTGCPGRCSSSAHHRSRTHFNRRTLAHQRPRTGWCPGRGHLVPPSRAEPARWSHRRARGQPTRPQLRRAVGCRCVATCLRPDPEPECRTADHPPRSPSPLIDRFARICQRPRTRP
jgi:hypothetical protein